jgi:hypothetical protein
MFSEVAFVQMLTAAICDSSQISNLEKCVGQSVAVTAAFIKLWSNIGVAWKDGIKSRFRRRG